MKKKTVRRILIIILLLGCVAINNKIFAAGNFTLSKSSVKITEGKTTTVSVNGSNATGRIDIQSSDSSIVSVSKSNEWIENNSISVTLTGKKVGNATITVSGTVSDSDGNEALVTKSVSVIVNKVQVATTNNIAKKDNQKKKTVEPTKKEVKKEETKKETPKEEEVQYLLKELKISQYNMIPNFNSEVFEYTVNIKGKSINKLEIEAVSNIEGAIINIIGNENLNLGENIIKIEVKGQDDKQITIYTIKVLKEESEIDIANNKICKLKQKNKMLLIVSSALIIAITILTILTLIITFKQGKKKEE